MSIQPFRSYSTFNPLNANKTLKSHCLRYLLVYNVDPDQTPDQDLHCLPICRNIFMFYATDDSSVVYIFPGKLRVGYLEIPA